MKKTLLTLALSLAVMSLGSVAFAANGDQRESVPRKNAIHMTPQPNRFVEQLEGQLVDLPSSKH